MKNEKENTTDPFKVFVRVRPLQEREISGDSDKYQLKSSVSVDNCTIYVVDPESVELYGKKEKKFTFDEVFIENHNNNYIFDKMMRSLIDNIMLGYNSTALAYGVTGTGKTHTMFGDIYQSLNFEKGLCMFGVETLFEKINSKGEESNCKVKINYLEIYNEQVIDLLVDKSVTHTDQHLMIVEDPVKGVSVPDLTEYTVDTSDQVLNLIVLGNSRRTMASTGANQFSSRSHAILQINVEQKSNKDEFMHSKLLLVDLAGSERGSSEKGIRREEGANINKSLLALGNCINILSDKTKKGSFVPYRDSKLTRLLKDSLGGNILTAMIACVSPASISYDETINTLQYASRARRIQKKVTKNVKEIDHYQAQYKDFIDSLKTEIQQLKEIINNQNILLRNRPLDSFSNEGNCFADFNPQEVNDDFIDAEIKPGLNLALRKRSELLPNLPILNTNSDFNYEKYEEMLNNNLNQFTETEFEDFEKKLEVLYFDKINLENQILNGVKDSTLNEKYTIVKSFYEKYVELLNEKMVENIEQNMILKFNLKEILELNNTNINNLGYVKEQLVECGDEDRLRLQEEKENIEKIIEENEKERESISQSLEKNLKVKALLKKLLFKFLSNTQMKEMRDLQQAFTGLANDKRELEVKNKKYQEFLNSVMKEKDDKDIKIIELNKEIEKLKKKVTDKEKRIVEVENRNRDLEVVVREQRTILRRERNIIRKGKRKGTLKRKRIFCDDTEIKTHSMKRLLNDKVLHINFANSNSNKDQPKQSASSNNVIVENRIPRVTAILHDEIEVGQEEYLIAPKIFSSSNSIGMLGNLKKNLKKEEEPNSPSKNNTPIGAQSGVVKNSCYKSHKGLKANLSEKFQKELAFKDFMADKDAVAITSNNYIHNIPTMPVTKKKHSSNSNVLNRNYQTNVKNGMTRNTPNKIDSISISAVTNNNEMCLNSSELEIMDDVLNLDGINNKYNKRLNPQKSNSEREKLLTPVTKNSRHLLLGSSPKNVTSSSTTDIFQNALKAMKEELEVKDEDSSS